MFVAAAALPSWKPLSPSVGLTQLASIITERRWAFSDRNAGASYATFYKNLADLNRLDWSAIQTQQWSAPTVKDAKQAEFLVEESLPWDLIERIGVQNERVQSQVSEALVEASHQPEVVIRKNWYY